MRWGEVKRPILKGMGGWVPWWENWVRIEEVNAAVLPFPLVPAMWAIFRRVRSFC